MISVSENVVTEIENPPNRIEMAVANSCVVKFKSSMIPWSLAAAKFCRSI
jgi:hypothetical protein